VAVCRDGAVERIYAKRLLPTYDVFDEDRYFAAGDETVVIAVAGERVGILVCEDLWRADDAGGVRGYAVDPVEETIAAGATLLAVPSASPFVRGKDRRHAARLHALARRGLAVVSVNQVGGNDDLIFDGRSRAIARGGGGEAILAAFAEETRTVELGTLGTAATTPIGDEEESVRAIVLGIRDYLAKTGHRSALLGLSGGIDSALVAALAALAIGPAQVRGVLLPSRHSSPGSVTDALESVRRLGLAAPLTIPIEPAIDALRAALAAAGTVPEGVTDENLQSRVRGILLMALSNASGGIVLSTGNKSELAVGYATLYGDMNGGLAPIGDLPKTDVYRIAHWMNAEHRRLGLAAPPIPEASIEKPPSAELRPDQTDQDSLPPYEILDAIVAGCVEREASPETIAAEAGLDLALVRRWCRTIDRMQYKRDQAAVILKLSPRAFGRGRPMPIAARGG
jgi:NAD+ synthase/NAD+ synthase (glutamine-hydrolysing)